MASLPGLHAEDLNAARLALEDITTLVQWRWRLELKTASAHCCPAFLDITPRLLILGSTELSPRRRALPGDARPSAAAIVLINESVSEFVAFVTSEAWEGCLFDGRDCVAAPDCVLAIEALGELPALLPPCA